MLGCPEVVLCTACMAVWSDMVHLHHVISQIQFPKGQKTLKSLHVCVPSPWKEKMAVSLVLH